MSVFSRLSKTEPASAGGSAAATPTPSAAAAEDADIRKRKRMTFAGNLAGFLRRFFCNLKHYLEPDTEFLGASLQTTIIQYAPLSQIELTATTV
jgi:hypothetical protein